MKLSAAAASGLVVGLVMAIGVQMPATSATPVTKKLLWSEEFNGKAGASVNTKIWNFDIGDGTESGIPGWGNSEREYYIQSAIKQDGKGSAVITATKMNVDPSGQPTKSNPYLCYYGTNCEWTSAKVTTLGKVGFQYGRMEARIKMPAGVGTWPAFWMLGADLENLGWPDAGELDIVEARGADPTDRRGASRGVSPVRRYEVHPSRRTGR